jgi:hypothetical protein
LLTNLLSKKRYWGIVVDESNFKIVPFAKVKLIKFENNKKGVAKKLIATTIANTDGKYFFNYKGSFDNLFIEVHSIGFKKFYKQIDTLKHIQDNGEVIYDVFLSGVKNSLNSSLLVTIITFITKFVILVSSIVGLLLCIYLILANNDQNGIIMGSLYIFILYFTLDSWIKRIGYKRLNVIESLLMQKIPGAVVRLYDKRNQLHIAVTNLKGGVLLDWTPGEHQILVTKRGYELLDENTGTKDKKMFLGINKYVKLKKKFKAHHRFSNKNISVKAKTSLDNPFKSE